MALYKSMQDLIGSTPLVRLHHFSLPEGVRLFAKLELWNPAGSVKDRIGKYMPACIGWLDVAGIKWAGGFQNDQRRQLGLPYVTSLILLADPRIGTFRAVMDGAWITTMRTGAQTAVALRYLFPQKEIRIGLYGAGAQGRTQISAISQWFDILGLTVYDIVPGAAARFADEMAPLVKGKIEVAGEPEQAAEGDAIITVTQSRTPIVRTEWVRPGTLVFPMGSYQEVEDSLLLGADKIIVDHVEQCLHRGALSGLAQRGKLTGEDIYATVGELAAGSKKVDRIGSQRIVVVPIGTGAMDIAVAGCVYFKALERGIGSSFEFVRYDG